MILKNSMSQCQDQSLEWVYLVNETLEGEKTIVPLLRRILFSPICRGSFREVIERQLDEEVEHVRMYHRLVGQHKIDRNSFRIQFSDFVDSLPSVTLKLFALQGMLEGLALGALHYRIDTIEGSPSAATDQRALEEEMNHTVFSFPHFKYLISEEGPHSLDLFKETTRQANNIFSANFNGAQVAGVFSDQFGVESSTPEVIEKSDGMADFRRYTRTHIINAKNEFIDQYKAAVDAC